MFLFLLLLLDVATKQWAIRAIPPMAFGTYPFGGIPIFSWGEITFSLNTIVNTGAAWGLFAGHPTLLFFVRILIILGVAYLAPKRLSIGLILTGAVGNIIDYCLYGHVIDFFHFTFWGYSFPIFNIADSCITLGTFALLLCLGKTNKVQPSEKLP